MKRSVVHRVHVIVCTIAFFLAGAEVFAESNVVEQWLETTPFAERYSGIRTELNEVYEREAGREAPDELVRRFLREATVKQVPPRELVAAFETYIGRLVTARGAVERTGGTGAIEDNVEMLESAVVLLQTSAGDETLELLLERAESARHAREAFFTLSELYGIDRLTDEQLRELGRAVLESALPADSYASLASIYVQSRARRRPTAQVVTAIVETLEEGGGLIQVREALRR